jgi:hypothetical protein
MPSYRLTLYRRREGHWQYCQLTATADGRLRTATGQCGQAPVTVDETPLAAGGAPQQALLDAGAAWRKRGYDYPKRHELKILSLHFRVPGWSGFPAGAPWFEDWKTYYQEPMEEALEATVNGFARGLHRAKGSLVLYYYVVDVEAARATVEAVMTAAPVALPLAIYFGEQEYRPGQELHAGVPGALAGLFENFGAMAQTVAEASQNILFHTVALTPQVVHESSRQRVKGADAVGLRRALADRWHFDCHGWPPIGGSAPEPVAYTYDLPADKLDRLQRLLSERLHHPAYLLDCDDGVFELDPAHLLRGAYEGMVFDAGLEWVVYFSHHHTITFGGGWLLDAVRELYAGEPEALHFA